MKYTTIILLFLLSSCAIKKTSNKEKINRETKEQTEIITKRKGDTVSFTIPKITYKDTTIYTVNRQGTTLRTVYNDNGNVSQVDCFSSYIEEITRSNKEVIEAIKTKEKDKEESVSSLIVLYAMLGLALIVLIVVYFLYKTINKNSELIKSVSDKF